MRESWKPWTSYIPKCILNKSFEFSIGQFHQNMVVFCEKDAKEIYDCFYSSLIIFSVYEILVASL